MLLTSFIDLFIYEMKDSYFAISKISDAAEIVDLVSSTTIFCGVDVLSG